MTTADTTLFHKAIPNEEALVETLHDIAMSKKGPDAVIARGMKALMPAAIRWLEEEKARGTDISTIAVATAHLTISLHISLLLNIVGSAKVLARVLPELITHARSRYDNVAAKLRAEAETKPTP